VQSSATSSEVRFSAPAIDGYRELLRRYPTRQATLLPRVGATAPVLQLNHERYCEKLTKESTVRLIDELAGRDN
jgi:hypothetical protein